MKLIFKKLSILFALLLFSHLLQCGIPLATKVNQANVITLEKQKQFQNYWQRGAAEISSYTLLQSRYGQVRKGKNILLFVVQPFSKKEHIKPDLPKSKEDVDIIKLNWIRRFTTGIYDYSLMSSTFTTYNPSEGFIQTLKTNTTIQDWCGQVFAQLNRQRKSYKINLFSYFMSEAKHHTHLPLKGLLEEEVFTKIRISPELLPQGEIQALPNLMSLRILHKPFIYLSAKATHSPAKITSPPKEFQKESLMLYKIQYPSLKREFIVYYEKEFPYQIEGFEERTLNDKNEVILNLSTIAYRDKTIFTTYWEQSDLKNENLRKQLNL